MDFWRFFAIKRRNWSYINCKTFDGVSNQVINCDSRGKWRLYSKVSKLKGRKSNYRSRCTACWKWWRVWVRVHEWESVALGGHKMQAASAWRRCTWNGGPVPRQNQKDRFEILYPNWYRGQWTWSVRDRNRFHGFLFDGRSIEGKECKTVGYSKNLLDRFQISGNFRFYIPPINAKECQNVYRFSVVKYERSKAANI